MTNDEANVVISKIGKRIYIIDSFCGKCPKVFTKLPIVKNTEDASADLESCGRQPF